MGTQGARLAGPAYFDAAVTRFMDAQRAAAAAGFSLAILPESRALHGWRLATGTDSDVTPFGHVIVTVGYGPILGENRVGISRCVFERSSLDDPSFLLHAANALHQVIRDSALYPANEGEWRVLAYVLQGPKLVVVGVPGHEDRACSASYDRWSRRLGRDVLATVTVMTRRGSRVGVAARARLSSSRQKPKDEASA